MKCVQYSNNHGAYGDDTNLEHQGDVRQFVSFHAVGDMVFGQRDSTGVQVLGFPPLTGGVSRETGEAMQISDLSQLGNEMRGSYAACQNVKEV